MLNSGPQTIVKIHDWTFIFCKDGYHGLADCFRQPFTVFAVPASGLETQIISPDRILKEATLQMSLINADH